jgi:ATP synthase protein I
VIDSARLFRASAPLPATPLFQNDTEPPSPDSATVSAASSPDPLNPSDPVAEDTTPALTPPASDSTPVAGEDDYTRLQRRLIQATLIVSALAVAFTALTFDPHTAGCLLVGSLAGVLYLRLLARSVAKLGNGSKKVGKLQLLVPVVLVLASARLPQLDLLPALIGFLLYKPALILQALADR